MSEVRISIGDHCNSEISGCIEQGLIGFNASCGAAESYQDLVVLSHHGGDLVGGLIGNTNWNWLFVKQLRVAESFRRRGIGRRLMIAAEREARLRGCAHAHCDTFDFQALPFYEKLGYRVFGQLEDYPAGHTRFFLHKRDLPAHEVA